MTPSAFYNSKSEKIFLIKIFRVFNLKR